VKSNNYRSDCVVSQSSGLCGIRIIKRTSAIHISSALVQNRESYHMCVCSGISEVVFHKIKFQQNPEEEYQIGVQFLGKLQLLTDENQCPWSLNTSIICREATNFLSFGLGC
jgi:hypothetical protein